MNQFSRRLNGPLCFCLLAVGGVAVTAGGLAAQEKSDTVEQLIKQLLNESFDVRREAKQKLFELLSLIHI